MLCKVIGIFYRGEESHFPTFPVEINILEKLTPLEGRKIISMRQSNGQKYL